MINETLKRIIDKGNIDLETISFEFDIPMEQLLKYKEESRNQKKAVESIINEFITEINEHYDNQFDLETNKKTIKECLSILSKLKKEELTMEQCEYILSIIDSKQIKIQSDVEKLKIKIESKYITAIGNKSHEVSKIEELIELSKKLTPDIQRRNYMMANGVKSRIDGRIEELRKKQVIRQMQLNIPTAILQITSELANGTIDIEKANAIINAEATRIVESKPKTRFSLNEEQQRKQLLMQIKGELRKNAEQYPIQNPILTIEQLQKLCNEDLTYCIDLVVQNLIARKNFTKAQEVCDNYCIKKDTENPIYPFIHGVRQTIIKAQKKANPDNNYINEK